MEEKQDFKIKKMSKEKIAAMSYLWVLCLIPLFISKDEFVQFHAKQGFALFLVEVLLVLIAWIPIIGWTLGVLVISLAILGFKKALAGEKWKMPFIYELSKKINLK